MTSPGAGSGRTRRVRIALLKAGLVVVAATAGPTLCLRAVDPPTSSFILQARWRAAWDDGDPVHHTWVALDRIAPAMQLAVIVAEDQRFPEHRGFDLRSIERSIRGRGSGRDARLRGASTISQQVAKNLFLWPGRSWLRKGIEAWFTVWIEACWPKRRILEVYLNIAEFGKGNYGVGAASETFFARPPAELTDEQGALLAAVLPNPRTLRAWNPGPYARQRTKEIQHLMAKLGTGYLARL